MSRLAVICLVLCLTSILSNFAHSSELPHLKAGDDYKSVRTKMLKAGWRPFHAKDAQACDEGDVICKKRPEMYACAGTGLGECKFLWQKEGKIIGICTTDDPPNYYGKCGYP